MTPVHFKEFGQSMVAVGLFSSNFLFWSKSGYFATSADTIPLLHTWSLAVEEQFYIIFPLLLIILYKYTSKFLIITLTLFTLASLGLAQVQSEFAPSAGFYLLPSRAWELLAGALVSLYLMRHPQPAGAAAVLIPALGLVMIVYSVLAFGPSTPFPSIWTIIPVGGTALIILCAQSNVWPGRLLAYPILVWIGLLSYSAYLWHQPLFAFARIRASEPPTVSVMMGLATLSFAIAYISWRFIEQPFRKRELINSSKVFRAATLVSVALLTIGTALHATNGLPSRLNEGARLATTETYFLPDPKCEPHTFGGYKGCAYGEARPRQVALWGDSHGMVWASSLARVLATIDVGLVNVTRSACMPTIGIELQGKNCARDEGPIFNYLVSRESPNVLVMTARWALYLSGRGYNNCEGGIEDQNPIVFRQLHGTLPESSTNLATNAIRATIQALLDANKTVIVVRTIPEISWNVPERIFRDEMFSTGITRPVTVPYACHERRIQISRAAFAPFEGNPHVFFVDPADLLCNNHEKGRCIAELDGTPLYLDDDHLSSQGARLLAQDALPTLEAALKFSTTHNH